MTNDKRVRAALSASELTDATIEKFKGDNPAAWPDIPSEIGGIQGGSWAIPYHECSADVAAHNPSTCFEFNGKTYIKPGAAMLTDTAPRRTISTECFCQELLQAAGRDFSDSRDFEEFFYMLQSPKDREKMIKDSKNLVPSVAKTIKCPGWSKEHDFEDMYGYPRNGAEVLTCMTCMMHLWQEAETRAHQSVTPLPSAIRLTQETIDAFASPDPEKWPRIEIDGKILDCVGARECHATGSHDESCQPIDGKFFTPVGAVSVKADHTSEDGKSRTALCFLRELTSILNPSSVDANSESTRRANRRKLFVDLGEEAGKMLDEASPAWKLGQLRELGYKTQQVNPIDCPGSEEWGGQSSHQSSDTYFYRLGDPERLTCKTCVMTMYQEGHTAEKLDDAWSVVSVPVNEG